MKMYIMFALPEDHRCSKYADYLSHSKIPSRNMGLNPIKQQRTNKLAESFHAHFNAIRKIHIFPNPAQNPTSTSPLVSWGQHIVIFYVVILLYGELKGSLSGHKLVKPGHYLENSLICMIFQSALLTVWFAAHFILCHGMISAQT